MNQEFLKDLYKEEEHGLKSARKFYKFSKDNYKDKKYTLKQIQEFVDNQKPAQVFKQVKKYS